jgi:hypothetical protein
MSDNWLQLIPTDPSYQPTHEAASRARALLARFTPRADEVNMELKSSTVFFHPGGNWSGVKCHVCGADAEQWWQSAMDLSSKANFADLSTRTKCCQATVSLNDLNYVWPAGFGTFVLEAMNPDVPDLEPNQLAELQATLGCNLRKIWVHL